ncbi:M16 family metallopeptidase [Actinoplanes sp. NPDC048988]|uniref:M16 family metallopeptidase n=1 Tax=Actinoplanes sp. NPDC048988 TaxID=3363901 RepID=UPI0037162A93
MIKELDVDGVPTLLAPTTGPSHAGLAFRVGFADEPLHRRGITHLVEHLALYSTGVADYHYNGATGVEYTYFHMQGSDDDLAGFLTGVCSSLRDLPMGRLAVEKDLLQAEANGRNQGAADSMPLWRHGARDYGMPSYPEWGLPGITEDDLRAWVSRYFTRENAVLWVAGDGVPEGLKLDLPSGTRQPAPAPSMALPVTPAYFTAHSGVLVWDAEVARAARSSVFAGVLEREMRRELRQEAGLSYTAQASYEPLGADRALVTAVADSLPDKQDAVLGGFVDVLAALRAGRIDEADVAAVVKQRAEALHHAEEQGARLPGQALNLLAGRPVQSADEAIAETRAVGPAEVAEVAGAACANGLLMAPRTRADWAGFTAAPSHSESAVPGTEYASWEAPDETLIIGPEGVSIVRAGEAATVRFDACAIVRAWPDGARYFVGHDGIVVGIEPTLWSGVAAALPWLDAHSPAAVRVDQPPRDPAQIPQPEHRAAATANRREGPAISPLGTRIIGIVALVLAAPIIAVVNGDGPRDAFGIAATIGILAVVVAAGLAGGLGVRRLLARLRRR